MTMKSVFDAGPYTTNTVEKIMQLPGGKSYLTRLYFNWEKISFTADVLKALSIIKKYQFKKPGINKELYDSFHKEHLFPKRQKKRDKILSKLRAIDEKQFMGVISHEKRIRREKRERVQKTLLSISNQRIDKFYGKKAVLQGRNHGR